MVKTSRQCHPIAPRLPLTALNYATGGKTSTLILYSLNKIFVVVGQLLRKHTAPIIEKFSENIFKV